MKNKGESMQSFTGFEFELSYLVSLSQVVDIGCS